MTDWTKAACRTDPEAMYGDGPAAETAAKRLCAGCPLQAACLTRAINTREPWGMWGGHSVAERERLRTGRLLRACKACGLLHVPAAADHRLCAACAPAEGKQMPPGAGKLTANRDLIVSLAVDGWNSPEIAALLNAGDQSVRNAAHRWGIDLARGRQKFAPCGTLAAARRHYRAGESLCEACRHAQTLRERRRREQVAA